MAELGDLLRKAREEKGLTLAEVEAATKIRSVFLQALEEESFDRLPPGAYVHGFIRNYAQFLGIDPQQALALYGPVASALPQSRPTLIIDEPLQPFSLSRLRPVVILLLIVALAAGGWWGYTRLSSGQWPKLPFGRPTATPTATSVPETPTPEPTATPTTTPTELPTATPTRVGINVGVEIVGQRSWLRVEVDGQAIFEGTFEPGTTNAWSGNQRIVLRSGNAGAVRVSVNGQVVGLMGQNGQVVEQEWTAPGVATRTPKPTATQTP